MKKHTIALVAIVYMALSACADIKYKEPLPHGVSGQGELPDELLGKYEVFKDGQLHSLMYIIQVSKQQWAMQEQECIRQSDVDGRKYLVRDDSLWYKNDSIWEFRQRCTLVDDRYELDDLETSYKIDLKRHLFSAREDESGPKKLEVRRKDGIYYFNVIEGDVSLYALAPTKQGLRLCYLSHLNVEGPELPFPVDQVLTNLSQGEVDTSYRANPTNAELAWMMRDTSLYKFEELVRVE